MKRVILIFGCLLVSIVSFVVILAGSAWASNIGQDREECMVCQYVVVVEDRGTAVQNSGPSIEFEKHVGLDPNICASENQVTVPSGGGTVYYCYHVENTGDMTLTLHTVVDDQLGTLLGPGFPVDLTPGAIGYFTFSVNITQTTINSATWTAYNPGPTDVVTDSDTALVKVEGPIIALTATNDGPTTLGRETTLATIIEGGGFETYSWNFGDNMTGSGAVITHVYPSLGVYTAVVTATNAFNSLTATTVVTVVRSAYMPAVFQP